MLYQLPNPLALKGYGETSKDVCNNEGTGPGENEVAPRCCKQPGPWQFLPRKELQ